VARELQKDAYTLSGCCLNRRVKNYYLV